MTTVTGFVQPIGTQSLAFVGPIVLIESYGRDRIVLVTAYDYRLSLLGRFDYTSESSLGRSRVSGIEVERVDGEPVMSVRDFEVAFQDLRDLPQLLAGADTILGGSGFGSNDLHGFGGDDLIVGGPSSDVLDGGPGRDVLRGGLGHDLYYVDRPDDLIEDPDGGQVFSTARTYTLPEPLSALAVAPGGKAATLIGNDLDNSLYGRGGKDRLEGRAGDDYLDGGSGADTLLGGPGDDRFIVDNPKDRLLELPGEGVDTVQASKSFTLPAEVENLEAWGRKLKLVGNDLDNRIEVKGLAALVDGRGGDDRLLLNEGATLITGGSGADRLVWERIDGAVDTLRDLSPLEGDVLELGALFLADATADPTGFLRLVPAGGGALLELDRDGPAGPFRWAPLVVLNGVAPGAQSLEALLAAGAFDLG